MRMKPKHWGSCLILRILDQTDQAVSLSRVCSRRGEGGGGGRDNFKENQERSGKKDKERETEAERRVKKASWHSRLTSPRLVISTF